jgi:hypothetical protein
MSISISRVNAAFELVSAMRQSALNSGKRALEQQVSAAAAAAAAPQVPSSGQTSSQTAPATSGEVDDRRKLAIALAVASAPATAASSSGSVRRHFSPSEIQELANVLQELATSNAELAVALGVAAQEWVPPDHRGFGFWDYFAISLYRCERNADAVLVWNRAVQAVPSHDDHADAKTTKAANPTLAATQAAGRQGALPDQAAMPPHPAGPVGSPDRAPPAPAPTADSKTAGSGSTSSSDSDGKVANNGGGGGGGGGGKERELPLRPRVRRVGAQQPPPAAAAAAAASDLSPGLERDPRNLEPTPSSSSAAPAPPAAGAGAPIPGSGSAIAGSAPDAATAAPAAQTTAAPPAAATATAESAVAPGDEEEVEAGVGVRAVEVFSKSDGGNMAHIRHNMNFALGKLKCGPVLRDAKDQLQTADRLFVVTHRRGWTSSSIPHRFHAFNPSIITHPTDSSKFLVNLRAGNYFMNDQHRYEFPPGMSGITTINFLGSIDHGFKGSDFGETKQIKSPPMPHPYPHIAGLEDIRLIWEPHSKRLYGSFTSLEVTREHRPQVCLMQLDYRKGRVVGNPVHLHGFENDKSQKNWIGFADAGRLYFIYSLQPITVLQANPKTGDVRVVSVDASPAINEWRGSSPLIDLSDDLVAMLPFAKPYPVEVREADRRRGVRWFLALVHVSHFPKYHHQFIIMRLTHTHQSDFRPFSMAITHQSPPFVFERHDVEFSCGAAFSPDHSELVVPYSKRDNDCTCIRIQTTSILQQNMFPIPDIADFHRRS